jgi:hypothetical protein
VSTYTWSTEDRELFGAVLEFLSDREARLESAGRTWAATAQEIAQDEADWGTEESAEDYWVRVGKLNAERQSASNEALRPECAKLAQEEAAKVEEAAKPPMPDPFVAPPTEFKQGLYRGENHKPGDGYLFVYLASGGTHWLAKHVKGDPIKFHYLGAAPRFTNPSLRLSDEMHANFGMLFNACGYCATPLTDGESKTRGYGPTCAKRHGLPYGPNA